MNSKEVYERIERIADESGTNAKQALILKYLAPTPDGSEMFLNVLRYAIDPFTTYGIRPTRATEFGEGLWDEDTFRLLDDLAARKLTGGNAQASVDGELRRLEPGSSELLWRVINKDLRAGFSDTAVNKVRKGTFKEFPYQRCSLPKHVELATWPWGDGVISQIKADGMFANGDADLGNSTLSSRQGQVFPQKGYEDLLAELALLKGDKGTQTHGELLVVNEKGEILAREIGNGILNKVNQGGEFPEGHYPIYQVWDRIPLSSVKPKAKYMVPYADRLRALKAEVRAFDLKLISIVETRIVHSLKEAYMHYAEQLKLGKEGTVLKLASAIWKDGTSKEQIKLKLEAPCELEVVGFEPGKEGAKTSKTFGSLQLRSACGLLEVNCSGFTDALRQEIWDNRNDWLGAIVTVISNGIMYSDNLEKRKHSLFLPRFEERRYDKSEADTFERIMEQFNNAVDQIAAEAAASA